MTMTTMTKMATKQAHPATLGSSRLPRLPKDLRKTVADVLSEFTEDVHTFREVYEFLREYATRTQACLIIRFPDLVWDYCDHYFNANAEGDDYFDPEDGYDFFDGYMRKKVRKLVKEAIRRLANDNDWEYYYSQLRSEVGL